MEENTPWYETIGLKFEKSEGGREVTAAPVLAYNVTKGLIEAASTTALAPAFVPLQELMDAPQNVAAARREVLELIIYCARILTCLVDAAKTYQLSYITTKVEKFQHEVKAIREFVEVFGVQRGCCHKIILGSRYRSTAATHRSKLENLQEALSVVYDADNNERAHEVLKMLKDREPPRLSDHPKIPLAVLNLPKTYVKWTAMHEEAVSALVNEERSSTAIVCLWGMGGGGKTVLASSIVRDHRVLSSFSNGIFWFHVGHEGKGRVALILELLAREMTVTPAEPTLQCPSAFDGADEAARHVSEIIKPKTLRCLVVLDNVWDVEVVNAFANTGIHILVTTTRESTVIPPECRGGMVEVGDMEEDEGMELLRKTSHTTYGPLPPEAKQVAAHCSWLPLTLSLAGAMAKQRTPHALSWRVVLNNMLRSKVGKLNDMRSKGMASRSKSICSTIDASVGNLAYALQELLHLMMVLASGVAVNSEMLASLWDVDGSYVKRNVAILEDRCLLQVVHDKYQLHDLVLEYLQMTAKTDEYVTRWAIPRQIHFLSRIEVILRYSAGDETFGSGGFYSLVALWNAVRDLDRSLSVEECCRKTLGGVTEIQAWRDAGRLLKLLGDDSGAEAIKELFSRIEAAETK